MKNSWNDMIPLLPLQESMSLTSGQGKLRVSAPCSISTSTPFMQLGHFTRFHRSCYASQFVLS
ncbi:hypothetical protein B296_00002210 [Ensete ventricosum]|uniref:Uncharacterized protein n=1 Tax=Ensete ventricosum TaxID=4639 RepID=A0A427B4N0_ENSVE|nr:hypothetical protein B296_00002210 [Ensete ventricosum]